MSKENFVFFIIQYFLIRCNVLAFDLIDAPNPSSFRNKKRLICDRVTWFASVSNSGKLASKEAKLISEISLLWDTEKSPMAFINDIIDRIYSWSTKYKRLLPNSPISQLFGAFEKRKFSTMTYEFGSNVLTFLFIMG